jgi:7tm Odorant receptor
MGFGQMLSLFAPVILNTFLPCYFGSELMAASEKLSASFFNSEWMQQSKQFKVAMKIFMENSKKPIFLSAFGTVKLTLENFLRIINSAYSYYAALKSLKF